MTNVLDAAGAARPAPDQRLHAADIHLFDTEDGPHLLLVDGSRLFKIDEDLSSRLTAAVAGGREAVGAVLAEHGLGRTRFIGDEPLADPPVRALSLAVAERCNLGCTYCYAEGGSFGGPARDMPWEVAEASVRRLFAEAAPGERVTLAFLGGEPLVNRALIRRAISTPVPWSAWDAVTSRNASSSDSGSTSGVKSTRIAMIRSDSRAYLSMSTWRNAAVGHSR